MRLGRHWGLIRRSLIEFSDALERAVARREKTIAAISSIAAAVGLIFAGVSALATWRQLQILNRERSTPFRAILWEKKVDSLREIEDEIVRLRGLNEGVRRYLRSFYDDRESAPSDDDIQRFRAESKSVDLRRDAAATIDAHAAWLALSRKSRFLWTDAVVSKLAHFNRVESRILECVAFANVHYYDFYDSVLFHEKCNRKTIDDLSFSELEAQHRLLEALRGDVKTDKFQQLDSDSSESVIK